MRRVMWFLSLALLVAILAVPVGLLTLVSWLGQDKEPLTDHDVLEQ